MLKVKFPDGKYVDIPGVCKSAELKEIKGQDWSLNPGRYVGATGAKESDFMFKERLEEFTEEFEKLNSEANELEEQIIKNLSALLDI